MRKLYTTLILSRNNYNTQKDVVNYLRKQGALV